MFIVQVLAFSFLRHKVTRRLRIIVGGYRPLREEGSAQSYIHDSLG